MLALHAYDVEQQRIVADVREPMLAEIRLAWWREQVEALVGGKPAPAQPILRALEAHALGVDLVALTPIEEGFVPLLTPGPLVPLDLAAARGAPLFRCLLTAILARPLTNPEAAAAASAGTRWALARLWRGGWGHAEPRLQGLQPPAFPDFPPTGLRPSALPPALAALDALAADDWRRLEAGAPLARAASPARQWRMARAALRS